MTPPLVLTSLVFCLITSFHHLLDPFAPAFFASCVINSPSEASRVGGDEGGGGGREFRALNKTYC